MHLEPTKIARDLRIIHSNPAHLRGAVIGERIHDLLAPHEPTMSHIHRRDVHALSGCLVVDLVACTAAGGVPT